MNDVGQYALAVEVRQFFDQVVILDQDWPGRTRGARVLIVGDRRLLMSSLESSDFG